MAVINVNTNRKRFYLNQKYDEKVEVGDSPELLKHILRDEVQKCVLGRHETVQSNESLSVSVQIPAHCYH